MSLSFTGFCRAMGRSTPSSTPPSSSLTTRYVSIEVAFLLQEIGLILLFVRFTALPALESAPGWSFPERPTSTRPEDLFLCVSALAHSCSTRWELTFNSCRFRGTSTTRVLTSKNCTSTCSRTTCKQRPTGSAWYVLLCRPSELSSCTDCSGRCAVWPIRARR